VTAISTQELPTYLIGFDMHVRGHLGMVKTLESFAGAAKVVMTDWERRAAERSGIAASGDPNHEFPSYFEGFGVLPPSLGDLARNRHEFQ